MSTTQAVVESYYLLNSPDPASLSPTPSTSSTQSARRASRLSPSSSQRIARRVSSHPALPSPNSLAPPLPTHPPLPHFPPAHAFTIPPHQGESRRSVQISSGGPVNWSRPLPGPTSNDCPPPVPVLGVTPAATPAPTTPTTPTTPARSPTSPTRPRTMSATLALRQQSPQRATAASPASSASDDETPTTPHLPPGAAAPEYPPPPASQRSWAVASDGCKGLGMLGIAEFEADSISIIQEEEIPCVTVSSRTSSEGSLGGESVNTATTASSMPSTPTRLQFVSETLESLSNPATLEELRSLRAKAAELDLESKRLRRLRGKEPAVSPRLLPRKKVPVVTAVELQTAPKPRRPAVRHSLITPSPSGGESFSLMADPLQVPSAPAPFGGLDSSAFAVPHGAASRRPFYAQGKAAMSVIEFSSRKKEEASTPSSNPFGIHRSRHVSGVVPTLGGLKREKSERAPQFQIIPAIPAFVQPVSPPPVPISPPQQYTPQVERALSVKSGGFLGKHKKLSRFLGKAQVA